MRSTTINQEQNKLNFLEIEKPKESSNLAFIHVQHFKDRNQNLNFPVNETTKIKNWTQYFFALTVNDSVYYENVLKVWHNDIIINYFLLFKLQVYASSSHLFPFSGETMRKLQYYFNLEWNTNYKIIFFYKNKIQRWKSMGEKDWNQLSRQHWWVGSLVKLQRNLII